MNSLTVDSLENNAHKTVTAFINRIVPDFLKGAMQEAETRRDEDCSVSDKDIMELKMDAKIFIDTVTRLEDLLEGTTIHKRTTVNYLNFYKVKLSLIKDGSKNDVELILHYKSSGYGYLRPFLITWKESGAWYRLTIP